MDSKKRKAEAQPTKESATAAAGEPEVSREDDEIVRVIDVFFNPPVDENTELYVVQYPLRASWGRYDLNKCLKEVRVSEKSDEVEMDIEVEVDSSGVKTVPQTLTSSGNTLREVGSIYAAGILAGNKFHLNPIHAIVKLCPSTSDQEQAWVPLEYHSSKSDVSKKCLQDMMIVICSPIPFRLSPRDYLFQTCPGTRRFSAREKRHALLKAVEELFKKYTIGCLEAIHSAFRDFVESASSLKMTDDNYWRFVAASCIDDQEMLESVIEEFATKIHDVFVPKSSLVIPEWDAIRAVVIKIFQAQPRNAKLKRDYILKVFRDDHNKEVHAFDLQKVMNDLCINTGFREPEWSIRRPWPSQNDITA